jgi:hypothetical protein
MKVIVKRLEGGVVSIADSTQKSNELDRRLRRQFLRAFFRQGTTTRPNNRYCWISPSILAACVGYVGAKISNQILRVLTER